MAATGHPGGGICQSGALSRSTAGARLFVEYAGHTIDVIDPQTGEVRTTQLFVATLGASSYTYAEATWNRSLPAWIAARTFGVVMACL